MSIVAISGGFDPAHDGHIRLIKAAADYGEVAVILNSDDWLIRKKGYCFMSFRQREMILREMRSVTFVHGVKDDDGTVCEALARIRPDYFANGGDRTSENTPELKLCVDLGIKPLFGVGGDKVASSSELVKNVVG